jgi:ribosomal RNA-processing protein 7
MGAKSVTRVAAVVNDFLALPIAVTGGTALPQKTTHYLYVRANAPKAPTEHTPREVFLVNVPIDATERHIQSLFADQLGGARIESVAFEGHRVGRGIHAPVAPMQQGTKRKREADSAPTGEQQTPEEVGRLPETWTRALHCSGSTAVATFVDRASAELALREVRRAIKSKQEVVWGGAGAETRAAPLGGERYLSHHRLRFPDHHELQASVDAYMTAFAAREEAQTQAFSRQRAEPDEDGFITVTRGGRNGPAREEDARAKEEELKKRQKNMIKDDFYRFQTREKKKEQAQDFVRGYEEDRRRVMEMKRRKGKIQPE